MKMNTFSIIMPNYNGEKYIEDAIKSVLNQTYTYWELIIVDDCSTDNSKKVIEKYEKLDTRIKFFENNVNKGVSASRNLAINKSKGRFISFLDSDDIWKSNKLEIQFLQFLNLNCKIVYSSYEIINESNKVLGKVIPPIKLDYQILLKSNYIGNLTGVFDAEFFGKPLIVNMGHEDYILWLDLIKKIDFAYGTEEILAMYRKKEKSVSSNKFKAIKWQWKIYRENQKISFLKSVYLMWHYAFHGVFKIIKK